MRLFRLLKRMTSLVSERHVIWESPDVLAYLDPSPWTPGATLLTHRCTSHTTTTTSLFHLPEDVFLRLLLAARTVASLLCQKLEVQRCALIHMPGREERAVLQLLPLHGLQAEWKPHQAGREDFQTHDPGYVSSKNGPRWTDTDLERVQSAIRAQLPDPEVAHDHTFMGAASDPGLFPRIIRGEERQWRVWDDEGHVAFLTPFPNTPGFTVLVPRKPLSSDIFSLEEDDYRELVLAARKVSRLLGAGLEAWGVGLIFEGFEIDYAHVKLVPLVSSPLRAVPSDPPPEFFHHYPGFVTSVGGPPASAETLREIGSRIRQDDFCTSSE